MRNKLVSVVINTYNRKDLLSRAIDSVFRDNYENKEILVIDDCSTQNISEVIDKYLKYDNFRYIRNEKNQGLSYSRNIGWKNSSGEYIAFLDDDDEWINKDKLVNQVEFLDLDLEEKYFLVATSIIKLFQDGRQEEFIIQKPKNIKNQILRKNGVLYPSTVLMRKNLLVVLIQDSVGV